MYHEVTDFYNFRHFAGLEPIDGAVAQWDTPNDYGYSDCWVTRLVYEFNGSSHEEDPIIEFYSRGKIDQFVSSYYCDTFLGRDEWGNGYGYGLDLYGGVDSWKLTAEDADMIREWVEDLI